MPITRYRFSDLERQGARISKEGERISIGGVLTGSIIQAFGENPGIRASLRPADEPFARAKVFLYIPGNPPESFIRGLQFNQQQGGLVTVDGTYEHDPSGDYLGTIKVQNIVN